MAARQKMAATPHFLLIPLMAPGHFIPMMDMAKLLALRGVTVTIVATPKNASRFGSVLNRAVESGLPISFLLLPFPYKQAGLPEGCESVDEIPSLHFVRNFNTAANLLQQPLEQRLEELTPRPVCIVSDKYLPWTADTAKKFELPWITFDGMNCFTQLCTHNLYATRLHESATGSELFAIPNLPDRIEIRRSQLPPWFNPGSVDLRDVRERIREAESSAYGAIVNSFEELEMDYVKEYKKLRSKRVWCVGPMSLCNDDVSEQMQRGNRATIAEDLCRSWLDGQKPGSVVYACLGSLSRGNPAQLVQLGLGLETSKRPFIWVVRARERTKEVEKWMEEEEGFRERNKEKGLVIAGWAPQLLILSHPSVGVFLTHCGWNSTLEGVSAGLPMITWPHFGEQFFNEKLVVELLQTGVSVGAEEVVHFGEEEKYGVRVKGEEIARAIEEVMGEGEAKEERRKRARSLGESANRAVRGGGSSQKNLAMLIQEIVQMAEGKSSG